MNKKTFSFVIVIIFIAGVSFLVNYSTSRIKFLNSQEINIKEVKIAGQSIKVDLALTNAKREQGLSARVVLAENNGMLFVFDRSGVYPFWMKDMNFPIDIIWLDENLKVVYIKKDAQPESYPDVYGPEKKAKYVLEVSSGFSEKNNLQIGDGVERILTNSLDGIN